MLKRTLALLLALLLMLSCALADSMPDLGFVFNDTEDDTETEPELGLILENEAGDELSQEAGITAWDEDIDCGDLGDGVYWHYTDENVLYITGSGAMPDFEAGNTPWYPYRKQITELFIHYDITRIGANAFRDLTALTEIPNFTSTQITSIGNYAFSGCTSLRVATGNNYNPFVFAGYGGEFNLPTTLQTIGTGAFRGCTALRSVTVYKSLRNSGSLVFQNCTGLGVVFFEGAAPSGGKNMFSGCKLTVSYDKYANSWTETKKTDLAGTGTMTWIGRGLLAPEYIYGFRTTAGNVLVWSKVEGADGYQILRATSDSPAFFTPLKSVTGNSTTTALSPEGKEYYYKVRAYKLVNGDRQYGQTSKCSAWVETFTTEVKTAVSIGSKAYLSIDFDNHKEVTVMEGYQLWRSTSKNGTYTAIKSITGEWWMGTITNLPSAGTTYYFKARPFIELDGTRIYGDYCTPFAVNPLGKVTSAAAIRSGSQVNMGWTKVANATGYQIVRCATKTGTYSGLKRVTTNATGTAAPTSGTYYYKIRPYITMGGSTYYGEYSSPVAITTMAKPAITSITAQTGGKVTLKWSAVSGASGYTIYRSTSQNGTYTAGKSLTDLSWTVSKLTKGTTYWFKIKPYKLVDGQKVYGEFSAAKSVTAK